MNITINDIKNYIKDNITVTLKRSNKGWLLASAKINLPGIITIRGITVKKSDYPHKNLKDNVWIEPPVYRGNKGNWIKTVFFEDEEIWSEIERKIYDSYKQKKDEEINPDDIPF